MDYSCVSNSAEETQHIAQNFSSNIKQGGLITLYGNLGGGKTTFVQGIAKGLGVNRRIVSPTFVIIRAYTLPKNRFFYHIDLYRVSNTQEIQNLGIQEILNNPKNIVAIEWAEKMEELLPKKRWEVILEYDNEKTRKIRMNKR